MTLTPANGFSDDVNLSLSGLPSGASGGFSPVSVNSGSPSSTLTVTAPAGTAAGTYTSTISGADGTLTRTTTASLTNQPPPVALAASPTGVGGGDTVTVAWMNVSGPTRNNWIGLYVSGAANSAYLGGFFDDNCGQSAGTTSVASGDLHVQDADDRRHVRVPTLRTTKATTLLATSNVVTVTVAKASPTISTRPRRRGPRRLGERHRDARRWDEPDRDDHFKLYGPADPTCARARSRPRRPR